MDAPQWVLQVHEEHRRANQGSFVHNYKTMGSPNMTLDPGHVERKMDGELKTRREAARANLLPVFEEHHQEQRSHYLTEVLRRLFLNDTSGRTPVLIDRKPWGNRVENKLNILHFLRFNPLFAI